MKPTIKWTGAAIAAALLASCSTAPRQVAMAPMPAAPPRAELPPYAMLDAILQGLIERQQGVDDLVAAGHDRATVLHVWRMLDRAEYKRRQAPPGVRVTPKAFGKDRRLPITNRYRG